MLLREELPHSIPGEVQVRPQGGMQVRGGLQECSGAKMPDCL